MEHKHKHKHKKIPTSIKQMEEGYSEWQGINSLLRIDPDSPEGMKNTETELTELLDRGCFIHAGIKYRMREQSSIAWDCFSRGAPLHHLKALLDLGAVSFSIDWIDHEYKLCIHGLMMIDS
jgi:hypothetical protein